jgi:hypothetical protein
MDYSIEKQVGLAMSGEKTALGALVLYIQDPVSRPYFNVWTAICEWHMPWAKYLK